MRFVGAVGGILTLAAALLGLFRGLSRPPGRETGLAHRFIRWPFLVIATVCYVGLCVVLWRPLPPRLTPATRLAALGLGGALYFPGLALYLWAMRTLGEGFIASSGFGVRLVQDQRLVTHGPYVLVRHPMYLALIAVGLGGLLIYRTWTMAFFALNMFGLVFRARREEQALAEEFGHDWEAYRRRVPGWIPRRL